MKYRFLGKSGLQVSALSLGAWVTYGDQVGEEVAYGCMTAAYDAGVNFFDNAEVYANGNAEIVMGNVIKKTGWKRSDLVISTKIFWGGDGPNDSGLSRKHIIEGVNAALIRLQMDYVDLVFCHRPDLYTPIEETAIVSSIVPILCLIIISTTSFCLSRLISDFPLSFKVTLDKISAVFATAIP